MGLVTMHSNTGEPGKHPLQAGSGGAPVGAVMVVGGGVAGIQAALDLANTGYYV